LWMSRVFPRFFHHVAYQSDIHPIPVGVASNANLHAPSLPPKTRAAKLLVAWKGAHVGDDIGNIVRRQRTFEGWHVAAFAVGRTAFGNDAGHVAIVEQLGVALSVEGAHMGHEIFAAAATVGTVAARTVTLEERLTALGVCSRDRCRGKEQANGGVLDDAPP